MTGVDKDLATLREFLDAVEPTGNVELIYTSALPRVVPARAALDRVEAELARLTARRSRYAEARYENCMEALSAAEAEVARLTNKLNEDSQNFEIECLKAERDRLEYRAEAAEAELSRLREQLHMTKASRDDWERQAKGRGVVQYELLARAEAAEARCARLQQALKELRAKVVPSLIAVKGHLDTPYVDDERWTPWTRFVEPCLYRFDEVLNEALAGPDTPADSQPEENE